jgi:hypothetical protein
MDRLFIHKEIIRTVKNVEFFSNSMSYVTLRGRWRDIIILHVHVPTEDKSDDTKHSFYE